MDAIIEYLEKVYALTPKDLSLPDDERNFLLGQLSMIEEIKGLLLHGIPTEDEESE